MTGSIKPCVCRVLQRGRDGSKTLTPFEQGPFRVPFCVPFKDRFPLRILLDLDLLEIEVHSRFRVEGLGLIRV